MASYKKSFLLYLDQKKTVDAMSDIQAGKIFKACFAYNSGDKINLPQSLHLVFTTFESMFDRNQQKYEEVVEKRRAAANKRWGNKVDNNAHASKSIQKDANDADSVRGRDSVSDINDSSISSIKSYGNTKGRLDFSVGEKLLDALEGGNKWRI